MDYKIGNALNLGAFSDEEKMLLLTDFSYKKEMNKIYREARQAAKRETCYFCGKPCSSFCNSHSIPRFCLKNIATNGNVLTLNTLIDNPLMDTEKGVEEAGTFHLICNECDNKLFSDYETPKNYAQQPTQKMISQMALKNALKSISKRLVKIELFNIMATKSASAHSFAQVKNKINKIDLKEYETNYKKAKKALEKK